MSRRLPWSPAPAALLDDDDLLFEILLRLPPLPSSLPRASAVCKHWRRLVTDPGFLRRFRLRHRHRRSPPLLGFFKTYGGESFQPTLETPNRVAPGRFSLQHDRGDCLLLLGCRHGLALMLYLEGKQVLVWDPINGDQHSIALPPLFHGRGYIANGAVLRAAGDVHFQVVLVVPASEEGLRKRVLACVYSSETRVWGNLISTQIPDCLGVSTEPAVLVGDSLYWILSDFSALLEFDLERQSLAVMPLPVDMFREEYELTVMRAEGGGLGFLLVAEDGLSAQLWKRETDCEGVASWELGRTIELDKLLSLNSVEVRDCMIVLGFAECNNVVFLLTRRGLFMVELESLQFKKVSKACDVFFCKPFESVYAAEVSVSLDKMWLKSEEANSLYHCSAEVQFPLDRWDA